MKRRWKILIALAGAIGVVVLAAVIAQNQLRTATDLYIAQLKSEGEPMELAQVLPPPVPPGKNSADTFRKAGVLLDASTSLLKTNYDIPTMKLVALGKAMIGWQQPDVRGYDATNSWQAIGAAVAQNTNVFALLHKLTSKPDFDFQIPYSRGIAAMNFRMFGFSETRESAQWLNAAAVIHLHEDDAALAVDDVRGMLAITQAMRDERYAISELVRMAIAQTSVNTTWEILQSPAVTDAELARLQNDWANLDFITNGENALAMERVTRRIDLARWRASPSQFAGSLVGGAAGGVGTFWATISTMPKFFMWRDSWSYPDELRSLQGYEVLINGLRMASTSGSFETAIDYQNKGLNELLLTNEDDEVFFTPDLHSMLSQDVEVMRGFIQRVMTVTVAKQVVTTAIALKRYQLKHGNYPPNLDALVPEFLPAVPLDPEDGKPLRYRPNKDGTYLLYSVGFNRKDDGGNPALDKSAEDKNMSWLNIHALDWVWPQPATAAEIRNYWAHPPK